jgi:hypothetical protein
MQAGRTNLAISVFGARPVWRPHPRALVAAAVSLAIWVGIFAAIVHIAGAIVRALG